MNIFYRIKNSWETWESKIWAKIRLPNALGNEVSGTPGNDVPETASTEQKKERKN